MKQLGRKRASGSAELARPEQSNDRDRHGRLRSGATITSAAEFAELVDLAPRYQALSEVAKRIFKDRNAAGMPFKVRAEIKASARPVLRKALACAAKARDTIHSRDLQAFDLHLAHARGFLQNADVHFRQPFMQAAAQQLKTNKVNAARPRPNAKSALREKIVALMRRERKGGTDFKTFMLAWERATLDTELKLTETQAGKFEVDDWDSTEQLPRRYSRATLEKMWSE